MKSRCWIDSGRYPVQGIFILSFLYRSLMMDYGDDFSDGYGVGLFSLNPGQI